MSFTRPYTTMTAAIFLSLGTAAVTFAQQAPGHLDGSSAGYVRITDRQLKPNGQPVQQAGAFHHHHLGGAPCPNGSCPTDPGYGSGVGGYGNCPTGDCPYCRGCFHGKFCDHYCKHSPGYGYTPPGKYPLLRRGVQYDTMYPAQWYGAGGECIVSSAPMVYQPTDTTQLGFYYRHVPFWQPYPNPLPVRPVPAEWHVTPAPYSAWGNAWGYTWNHYGKFGHHLHHHHGRYYQGGYGMNGNCPVDGTWVPQQGTTPGEVVQPVNPSPTPVNAPSPSSPEVLPDSSAQELPQTSLPPTPSSPDDDGIGAPIKSSLPADSASSGHIRRIGYRN